MIKIAMDPFGRYIFCVLKRGKQLSNWKFGAITKADTIQKATEIFGNHPIEDCTPLTDSEEERYQIIKCSHQGDPTWSRYQELARRRDLYGLEADRL